MKKSRKSMAIAIAMVMGCLPKNSLAAPKNNSLANEDNSLAYEKLKSMMKTKQSSEKVSNFNRAIYGLTSFELIWETLGLVFKIPTPVKCVLKSLSNYPEKEIEAIHELEEINKPKDKEIKEIDELKKRIGELEEINKINSNEINKLKNKEINKLKNKFVKLRNDIKKFAATKKSYTSNEQQQTYKKILASIYNEYNGCKRNLLSNYHQKGKKEYGRFRVVISKCDPSGIGAGDRDDYYLYMLNENDESYKQIKQSLITDDRWSALCCNAIELNQKIVIGVGLYHKYDTKVGKKLLQGCISIGLKSDIEGNISNFTNGNFSIFDFTFYDLDKGKGINNLGELDKLLAK